ncbi:MAG: hypothetical protein JXO44_03315 [Clostridia bacterium]|nr:hypothetical protein [Clostridia bacterium]
MRENKMVSDTSSSILTVVAIVLTVVVLGIAFKGYSLLNFANGKIGQASNDVMAMEYEAYDGEIVYGDTVENEIENSERNPLKIKVTVTTLGADTTVYGYSSYDDETFSGYSQDNPSADDYINPVGGFEGTVHRNNGVVTGLTFVQKY